MHAAVSSFDIEAAAGVVVLTPLTDWFGLNGSSDEAEVRALLRHLESQPIRNVVIDLGQTSDCDSSALGFCMRLWKQVRNRQGRIALCNVSENEQRTLRVTKLDRLWAVFPSREEAVAALRQ